MTARPHKYAQTLTLNSRLSKSATSIAGLSPEVDAALAALNAEGYTRYYVQVMNSGKKHYIRYGQNANSGSNQWDGFIVGADGVLEGPVQWDFDALTQVVITPIPAEQSYVRNGTFVSLPVASKTEAPYGRGGAKPVYYARELQIRDCTNVQIANIAHTVGTAQTNFDNDELSGSYNGFLSVRDCADVEMSNCMLWARRYEVEGRSTYDLTLNSTVGITLTNVSCANPWEQLVDVGRRWGVNGSNHCKHVVFDSCTLNRIDAHEGFYDMTARNCKLGGWGFRLIGQGPLLIENCEVYATSFIMLRYDYGSTWGGDAIIRNCTHYAMGADSQGLVNIQPQFESDGSVHDFGYDLHFPNLTVENLTVDESGRSAGKSEYYLVPNHTYNNAHAGLPASYWPDSVQVSGIDFVNYENSIGYEPKLCLVSTEAGTISGKLAGYSVEGVTYSGVAPAANPEAVEQLLGETKSISASAENADDQFVTLSVTSDLIAGKDVVVEFTGTLPSAGLMDANWKGWASLTAYYVDVANHLAYFSGSAIQAAWAASREKDSTVGELAKFRLLTAGETEIARVMLAGGFKHEHEWSAWTQVKAPTCTNAGEERRVCARDATHAETRAVAATGHDWQSSYTVDKPATRTAAGSKSIHCTSCGATKPGSATAIPALGRQQMSSVSIVLKVVDVAQKRCKALNCGFSRGVYSRGPVSRPQPPI